MTDSTTDTTDAVDTPPVWPGPLSTVPAGTKIPAESAVEAMTLAGSVLADVLAYREQVRPCVEVAAIPESAFDDVATLRRSTAILADTLSRLGMIGGSLLAQQAARHAERIAGLVVGATSTPPREPLGSAADRCVVMAGPSDEDFAAALRVCSDAGVITADAVTAALAAGGLDVAEQQQRDTIARLAGQGKPASSIAGLLGLPRTRVEEIAREAGYITLPDEPVSAVDATLVVPVLIEGLRAVGAQSADLLSFDGVPPEMAADWSRQLWDLLVPLVGVRVAADKRGRQRP